MSDVTSEAGLAGIASVVARDLRGTTWADRRMRVWASGSSVRFEVPGRFSGAPSEAQCIVDLLRVGSGRSVVKARPFAGDSYYDPKFASAMESRVRLALK